MEQFGKVLVVVNGIVFFAALVVCGLLFIGPVAIPFILLLGLFYGWVIHAFLHYRTSRQEEFLHLLAAAAESGAPLAPAVRAYVMERPQTGWRAFWAGFACFFVLPGLYWVWYRRNNFDRKVSRVAKLLEQGVPLEEALQAEPGVSSQATTLAIAVGAATGRLATSLRQSSQNQLSTVWLETLPRLLYPLILLFCLSSIGTFWMIYIMPKLQHIFRDFGMELPTLTKGVIAAGGFLADHGILVVLGFHAFLGFTILVCLSPRLRWYVPILGRLYKMNLQSRVLKMLSVLVEAGKPLPEALGILAHSGGFPDPVVERLNGVSSAVGQGEPLADSLSSRGIVPERMTALIRTSERVKNLPWALMELGETLARKTVQRTQWVSLLVFEITVIAASVVVGLMVIGMFLPLVKLIAGLA